MLAGTAAFWTMCGLALWFGARAVCPEGFCRAPGFDQKILGAANALRQPWLDAIISASTWLGSIIVLLPLALALAWRHWRRSQRAEAILLVLALGGGWLLAHAGKLLVVRPRPDLYPALVSLPADLSFPSAHATQITAFVLAWLLTAGSWHKWRGVAAAALIVLVVAASRIYLQVHFPSDVVVGVVVGAAWVLGLRLLLGSRV